MIKIKVHHLLIVLLLIGILIISGCAGPLETKEGEIETLEPNESEANTLEECLKIETEYDRNDCIFFLAIDERDALLCDLLKGDVTKPGESVSDWYVVETRSRNACLMEIARLEQDSSFCNKMTDVSARIKDVCFAWVLEGKAISEKDESYCEQMHILSDSSFDPPDYEERFQKAGCLGAVAAEKEDFSLCEAISGYKAREFREVCSITMYKDLALKKEDKSYCDKINESTSRESCYAELAQQYGTPFLLNLSSSNFYLIGTRYSDLSSHDMWYDYRRQGVMCFYTEPEGTIEKECPDKDRLYIIFKLVNIDPKYYDSIKCKVYDGGKIITETVWSQTTNRTYIEYDFWTSSYETSLELHYLIKLEKSPEIRVVDIPSSYTHDLTLNICCRVVEYGGDFSNKACFQTNISTVCTPELEWRPS